MGSRLALIATFLLVALASAVLADSSSRNFHDHPLSVTLNMGTSDNEVGTCKFNATSRRVLAGASHISYDALNENKVPCNQRGSSYYNCVAGKRANPYQRGCSAATQCARY